MVLEVGPACPEGSIDRPKDLASPSQFAEKPGMAVQNLVAAISGQHHVDAATSCNGTNRFRG
jgi:hypothetical protein